MNASFRRRLKFQPLKDHLRHAFDDQHDVSPEKRDIRHVAFADDCAMDVLAGARRGHEKRPLLDMGRHRRGHEARLHRHDMDAAGRKAVPQSRQEGGKPRLRGAIDVVALAATVPCDR